jgi:anaerobic magnesium-protoporphyrin IX monomethyl ester cyclase
VQLPSRPTRRILLIPTPFFRQGRLAPHVPYGLLSLQALAQAHGDSVGVLSLSDIVPEGSFADSDELSRAVAERAEVGACEVVGLSTTCDSFHYSLAIAVGLKRRYPRLQVWLGGPHASVNPPLALERFPEIDAVFVGESELSFAEVLDRGRGSFYQPAAIAGVFTRGSLFSPRLPITDLDELPLIHRAPDYLSSFTSSDKSSYWGVPLEIERGCPGRCSFCSTTRFWGKALRYKSTDRIIAEMNAVAQLTCERSFLFLGDNLAARPDLLLGLAARLRREASGYHWGGGLTTEGLRVDDLELLWEGGCRALFVGIESGSQETLRRLGKRIDLKDTIDFVLRAIDRGIAVQTSFVVGFPWETSADLRKTYALHVEMLKRGARVSQISRLCPLPGSAIERTYRRSIRVARTQSEMLAYDIPFGPEALRLAERCPELFVQFGTVQMENAQEHEVAAVLRAARMASSYYEGWEQPT